MEAIPKKSASAKASADKPAAKKPAAAKPKAVKAPAVPKKPAVAHPKPKASKAPKPQEELKAAVEQASSEAVITSEPIEEKAAIFKVPSGKNYYGVGRRKTSVAQILLTGGNGTFTINKLPFEKYFGTADLQRVASQPLDAVGLLKQISFKAKVSGGGIHSQAEAVRHGISRAILLLNPESRRTLKKLGFLMRDPRVKERKKPGLKRARRAPQFSKR